MKKTFFIIFILSCQSVFSQSSTEYKALSKEDKQRVVQLVKDKTFKSSKTMNFNITTNDLAVDTTEMHKSTKKDKTYLNNLLSQIENDSLNPIILNDLGNYYQNKDAKLSYKYYSKALKHLDKSFFQKDSASFYSFRGLLKLNLSDTTSLKDMEKAIAINPNDTLGVYFYPLALLSRGDYKTSREFNTKLLDLKPKYALLPYFYLSFSEMMSFMQKGIDSAFVSKTNYDQLFDNSIMDKYHKEYKNDNSINNTRILMDLFPLYLKTAYSFDFKENKFQQKAYEEKAIREMIKNINNINKNKKINPYSAFRIIGACHFMLNETEEALSYFEKAIKHFPNKYEDEHFNLSEVKNNLLLIYYLRNDYQNVISKLYEFMVLDQDEEFLESHLEKLAFAYLKIDNIDKSEEYCNKLLKINNKNIMGNQMLAQVKFLKDYQATAFYYIKKAYDIAQSDSDLLQIIPQMAAYYVHNNQIDEAIEWIDKVIKVEEDCDVCHELLDIIKNNKQ